MNWKIYIVTHGPIIADYYKNDLLFSNEHFTFINVSENSLKHERFEIINKNEIRDYISIGKWYAEGEAIYNVFKNNLYKDYDYIGFIHWDYDLLSENNFFGSNFSETIAKLVMKNVDFISFSTFTFYEDYNQNIMMDKNYPNTLTGNGINCWDEIINDFNLFFNRDIDINLMMTKRINLCSAFLCKTVVFEELMSFVSFVIESKKLDEFDIDHNYRFQGGMLERYIGCFSHQLVLSELPLYHRSSLIQTPKKSKLNRIISLILKK